ncbi:phage tail protein [Neisseria gonorrhoeae]
MRCEGGAKVAQQLLQRALYVRSEYEFKLGWKYLLEPMDIVT